MPTYDYECSVCGHCFEVFQSITARPLRKCPACGKLRVRRLIGAGGALIFKGSGFYTTDYRSEEYKKRASDDKPMSASSSESGNKTSGKAKKTDGSDAS